MENEEVLTIKFNRYIVDVIEFRANPNFTNREVEIDIDINHKVSVKDDNARVSLRCILFKNAEEEDKPFFLKVGITGDFNFEGKGKDEERDNLLKANATAILFPYLRTLISTVTCNTGFPPLIIPVINVNQLIEQSKKKKS